MHQWLKLETQTGKAYCWFEIHSMELVVNFRWRFTIKKKWHENVCTEFASARRRVQGCTEVADNFRQGCLQNRRKPKGRVGSKLNIPQESVWKIVWKSLTLQTYLPQMLQNLAPNNRAPRFKYWLNTMRFFAEDKLCMSKTCFGEAAIFPVCETVNRHNFFLWISECSQSLAEQVTETPNINVVCTISYVRNILTRKKYLTGLFIVIFWVVVEASYPNAVSVFLTRQLPERWFDLEDSTSYAP